MTRQLIIFILIALLFSCKDSKIKVFLKCPSCDRLDAQAKVFLDGNPICGIDKVLLDSKDQIVLQITIDKDAGIKAKAKFTFSSYNLFEKRLEILNSTDNTPVKNGDTLYEYKKENKLFTDTIPNLLHGLIKEVFQINKNDTIVEKLEKIKEQLEVLTKKLPK